MAFLLQIASVKKPQLEHVQQLFQQESEYMAAEGYSQNLTASLQRKRATFFIKQERHNLNIQELREIQRMEFLIISTLNWRLQSITALCFLDYFISLMNMNDQLHEREIKSQAQKIVFRVHKNIEFTQFRPSIIAASAVLATSKTVARYFDFHEAILSSQFVDRDDFTNCMRDLTAMFISDSAIANVGIHGPPAPLLPPPADDHKDLSLILLNQLMMMTIKFTLDLSS
ncbi:unnamed protein product [Ilex paraguariensis]|uniref:Cyclin C-terminal domain-containing protein n=1 Tax=Ilex paraguariensis TaxID=185542 RepID=A0ABC8STE5_9AQUA